MTDIKIKRGIGKPDSLLEGELAIDTSTGMLYSLVGGVVTELNEQPEGNFVPYEERVANEWMAVRTTDFGTSDAITEDGAAVGFNEISVTNGGGGGGVSISSQDGPNGEIVSINTSNNWGNQVPIDMMVSGSGGTSQYVQYPDKFLFDGAPVQAPDYLDSDGNSIVYKHDPSHEHAPNIMLNSNMSDEGGIVAKLGGGADSVSLMLSRGKFDPTEDPNVMLGKPDYLYMGPNKRGVPSDLGSYEEPDKRFVNAYFEGKVQAVDFLDADGNSIIGGGGDALLKSENWRIVNSDPFDVTNWHFKDLDDGYEGTLKLSWHKKSFPEFYQYGRGNWFTSDLGIGLHCEKGDKYAAVTFGNFGWASIYATDKIVANTPEFVLTKTNSSGVTDENCAVKLKNDGPSIFNFPVQAQDFLDAEGNSIVGGGGDVDLSAYVTTDPEEKPYSQYFNGPMQALEWQASGAPYYVSIGQAMEGGIGMGFSPLYVETRNGVYEINSFSFLITGGTIQGKKRRDANTGEDVYSHIRGFASIQADDFLDADGNSIVQPPVDLTGYATEAYVGQQIAAIPPPAVPDQVTSATRLKGYEHGLVLGSSPGFGGNNLFVLGSNLSGAYESRVMMGNGLSQQFSIMYAANFYKAGSPMLSAVDLIDTFTTIKSAITEEQTVEGLRTAVMSGLDAVIAKLQAMEDLAEEEGHKR